MQLNAELFTIHLRLLKCSERAETNNGPPRFLPKQRPGNRLRQEQNTELSST